MVPRLMEASDLADIFDELNEDMRAERARAAARRYGVLGGIVLLVAAAGVGAWQGWEWWLRRQSAEAAGPYVAAQTQADAIPAGPSPARTTAADTFAALAKTAPAGYRTLAQLREAALRWDAGDAAAADALWDAVAADQSIDPTLRDLGALLWAQHAVDAGDPAAITAHTAKLEQSGNPWRALAEEVDALVAVRLNDTAKATRLLQAIAVDPSAAEGVRGRANGLLAVLGGPEPRG